MITGHFG